MDNESNRRVCGRPVKAVVVDIILCHKADAVFEFKIIHMVIEKVNIHITISLEAVKRMVVIVTFII